MKSRREDLYEIDEQGREFIKSGLKPLIEFTDEDVEEMHQTAIRNVAGINYNELVEYLKKENPFVLPNKQLIWDRAKKAAIARSKMMQEGGMQYPDIACETKKILFEGLSVTPYGMVLRILNDMENLNDKPDIYRTSYAKWICIQDEFQKYCSKHPECFGDSECTAEYDKFHEKIKEYVYKFVDTYDLV
ncbi:MAG: DUF1896 family protein [Bacteroidia bacterium]|nr:DUF1896 family protein [Bacteroidia bacterium]